MNRWEKIAWFNLVVFSISVVLYLLILFLLLRTKHDFFLSSYIATAAFALIALSAFGPLIFKKSGVIITEHGSIIRQKYNYFLFFGIYISISFGIWIWIKITGTIEDQVIFLIVFLFVSIFTLLAFILYLYVKRQKKSGLIADEQKFADIVLYGPDMDERDLQIRKSARWCGFGIFWLCYVFGIIGTYLWLLSKDVSLISIDIRVLPLFVFVPFILILVTDSITTIILYRRGK